MQRRYRVLVAESGADDQDRGVRPVARALRDAGFEVISVGAVDDAGQVVAAATQEDTDAVGVGVFAGADPGLPSRVAALVHDGDLVGTPVFVVASGPDAPDAPIPAFSADGPAAELSAWLAAAFDGDRGP